MEHLIEPGHRRHDGGLGLGHVGAQGFDALGVIDLGTDRKREELPRRVLIGMRQRQEGKKNLVAQVKLAEGIFRAPTIMHDGAVVQHHTLRRAAGAGRIYNAGRVIALPASDFGGNVECSRRPVGQNVVPDVQIDAEMLTDAGRLHGDHEIHVVGPVGRGQEIFRQPARRDDGTLGPTVFGHVQVIVLGVGGIGGNRDPTDRHDGNVCNEPFGTVFRDQYHPVADLQPQVFQATGQGDNLLGGLAPRYGVEGSFLLRPQERGVSVPHHPVEKHRCQIGPGVGAHPLAPVIPLSPCRLPSFPSSLISLLGARS